MELSHPIREFRNVALLYPDAMLLPVYPLFEWEHAIRVDENRDAPVTQGFVETNRKVSTATRAQA